MKGCRARSLGPFFGRCRKCFRGSTVESFCRFICSSAKRIDRVENVMSMKAQHLWLILTRKIMPRLHPGIISRTLWYFTISFHPFYIPKPFPTREDPTTRQTLIQTHAPAYKAAAHPCAPPNSSHPMSNGQNPLANPACPAGAAAASSNRSPFPKNCHPTLC